MILSPAQPWASTTATIKSPQGYYWVLRGAKKADLPYQAARLSPADLKTRGFPPPPHGGLGFILRYWVIRKAYEQKNVKKYFTKIRRFNFGLREKDSQRECTIKVGIGHWTAFDSSTDPDRGF